MASSLELEIKQTEKEIADHFAKAGELQAHLEVLKSRLAEEKDQQTKEAEGEVAAASSSSADTDPVTAPSTVFKTPAAAAPSGGAYQPIDAFYWEQGQYNSPVVTVYLELENVGSVADNVDVSFTKDSFDVKVHGLAGKNYRLLKNNLEKDIIPEESKRIVKKNKIVLKLQKKKGEYSYESWQSLTAKKSRKEMEAAKKDPAGGINDMIKQMYDEGDENMKKVIGEAMLKSRSGEKPDMPAGGMGGF